MSISGAYYIAGQNNYSPFADLNVASYCARNTKSAAAGYAPQGSANSTCAGTLPAESAMVDWRPYKRLDVYAGIMVSQASGGIASGYLENTNIAPTAGLRLTF